MDFRLFFRKLLYIRNGKNRELFRKYSEAEKVLNDHISHIEPFIPILGRIRIKSKHEHEAKQGIKLFVPLKYTSQPNKGNYFDNHVRKMGLTVESFDNITALCQRAEIAYILGDLSSAKAILDSLDEIQIPDKAKTIQDCKKKLQTIIK